MVIHDQAVIPIVHLAPIESHLLNYGSHDDDDDGDAAADDDCYPRV